MVYHGLQGVGWFTVITCGFIATEVAGGLNTYLLELKASGHESQVLLEFVYLSDALHHFLVAPLVGLDVQIMPNQQFFVERGVENLFLQAVPHVHHFS